MAEAAMEAAEAAAAAAAAEAAMEASLGSAKDAIGRLARRSRDARRVRARRAPRPAAGSAARRLHRRRHAFRTPASADAGAADRLPPTAGRSCSPWRPDDLRTLMDSVAALRAEQRASKAEIGSLRRGWEHARAATAGGRACVPSRAERRPGDAHVARGRRLARRHGGTGSAARRSRAEAAARGRALKDARKSSMQPAQFERERQLLQSAGRREGGRGGGAGGGVPAARDAVRVASRRRSLPRRGAGRRGRPPPTDRPAHRARRRARGRRASLRREQRARRCRGESPAAALRHRPRGRRRRLQPSARLEHASGSGAAASAFSPAAAASSMVVAERPAMPRVRSGASCWREMRTLWPRDRGVAGRGGGGGDARGDASRPDEGAADVGRRQG